MLLFEHQHLMLTYAQCSLSQLMYHESYDSHSCKCELLSLFSLAFHSCELLTLFSLMWQTGLYSFVYSSMLLVIAVNCSSCNKEHSHHHLGNARSLPRCLKNNVLSYTRGWSLFTDSQNKAIIIVDGARSLSRLAKNPVTRTVWVYWFKEHHHR